ncbi:hypothetical protein GGF32_002555 [Allomyces javanicus]|nr:hypothetical protein GGF32_002555 [Allomyces javanicus]
MPAADDGAPMSPLLPLNPAANAGNGWDATAAAAAAESAPPDAAVAAALPPPGPARERPFVCPDCGLAFTRHHDMARHRRLHSGDRPWMCHRCFRAFARLDALARHASTASCAAVHVPPDLQDALRAHHADTLRTSRLATAARLGGRDAIELLREEEDMEADAHPPPPAAPPPAAPPPYHHPMRRADIPVGRGGGLLGGRRDESSAPAWGAGTTDPLAAYPLDARGAYAVADVERAYYPLHDAHARLYGQVRDLEAELAGLQRARAVREARILAAENEAAAAAAVGNTDVDMDADNEQDGMQVPRAAVDAPWWGGRRWPPPPPPPGPPRDDPRAPPGGACSGRLGPGRPHGVPPPRRQ